MKHEVRIIQLIPDKDAVQQKPVLTEIKRIKTIRFPHENWKAPHRKVGSSWNGNGLAARTLRKKKSPLTTIYRTWNITDDEWFAKHPIYGND